MSPDEINELIKLLPEHWEVIQPDDAGFRRWSDDGRDYDKPVFIRKDGLARIYLNQGEENTLYTYAIAWDKYDDGDCCGDFEIAIEIADEYVDRMEQ